MARSAARIPASVAKALQTYVKSGSTRMAAEYPGMIKRMGSRIPLNRHRHNFLGLPLCRVLGFRLQPADQAPHLIVNLSLNPG